MIDKFTAIRSLCPGAVFQINDDDYESIIWHSPEIPIPTSEEVEQEFNRLKSLNDKTEYQRNRRPEYPNILDFVDAYYWSQRGDNTKMEEYLRKCDLVKQMYPKPEYVDELPPWSL
jgi:hypothetical protein